MRAKEVDMAEATKKKQKTSSKASSNLSSGSPITDPRFANIQSDPRYRLPGKKNRVKLDKRFARVLQDEDFVKRAKVDRYGRPLKSNTEKNRLKRKYDFDEDEEQSDAPDDDDDVQRELSRVEKKIRDPLREGRETDPESESSDETSTDSEFSDEDEEDAIEEELSVGPNQQQDVPTGEVTPRIAIVNLDWDNIRAADLMAVFTSFLPPNGGTLLKVSIYPSEFGKERLEREEMEGPPKEIFAVGIREEKEDSDMSDDEAADEDIKASILKNENGDEDFNPTALRKYQLERLHYFYAVLTFSTASVAKHIYDAVDGTEYLRTANFFDLRFVPDDTDFSIDVAREECERIPDDYKPNEFVTDALQHSKVKLTWDAEDTGRKEAVARAFNSGKAKGVKGMQEMMDENDLRAYLASDGSDDEDENDEAPVADATIKDTGPVLSKREIERLRTRSLLGLPVEPSKPTSKKDKALVGDMQITFTSGLNPSKDKSQRSVFENSPEPDETTLEKYVRKERERKQKRKDKTKNGSEDNDTPHEPIGEDGPHEEIEQQEEEAGDLGFADPFFADPSAIEKAASSNKLRKEERLKKRQQREAEDAKDRKQRAELELLMVDDRDDRDPHSTTKMQHFDMREIERAEKQARKKGKKGKNPKSQNPKDVRRKDEIDRDTGGGVDAFKINTSDPRFTRLFESHEYAIDPSNPRFKGTKGMTALLEEGRRRKGRGDGDGKSKGDDDSTPVGGGRGGKAEKSNVRKLVEKLKGRQ